MDLKEGLVYGNSHTIKEANLLEFPLGRDLSRKYITRNRQAVYATEILDYLFKQQTSVTLTDKHYPHYSAIIITLYVS